MGQNATVLGLMGYGGTITNNGSSDVTLTVDGGGGIYYGLLTDGSSALALSLNLSSSDSLTLWDANTYSGGTSINSGTLHSENSMSLGYGGAAVGYGGTLDLDGINLQIGRDDRIVVRRRPVRRRDNQ